jgi:hypothetical protein
MPRLPLSARTLLCLLAVLSFFSGGEVWVQDAAALPGSRVRVWTQANAKGRPAGRQPQRQRYGCAKQVLVGLCTIARSRAVISSPYSSHPVGAS